MHEERNSDKRKTAAGKERKWISGRIHMTTWVKDTHSARWNKVQVQEMTLALVVVTWTSLHVVPRLAFGGWRPMGS